MSFLNRRYSQKPNPFRPARGAAGLRRGHGFRWSRGTTYGFLTSPLNSPGRNFPRGRWSNGRESPFRRRDPVESDNHRFDGEDSWSGRTSSDESEQSLAVILGESLGRRRIHDEDFLSNRSPSSSQPPPLPPRLHDPKAAAKEKKDEDSFDNLWLALTMSLEEIKRKCDDLDENLTLWDNTNKMSLEDPKDEEENTCVICMDKPKTHAYIPCGHRVVCVQCSEKLKTKGVLQCIICRKKANGIFQIF